MGFFAPVLALGGAVMGFMAQRQAADDMEAAGAAANDRAKMEAANMRDETRENVFRQRTNNTEKLASLRQAMIAGGGGMGGSSDDVYASTAGRLELQILDSVRSGEGAARSRLNEGEMSEWNAGRQASGTRLQAWGNLFSGIGSAVGSMPGPSPKLTSLY